MNGQIVSLEYDPLILTKTYSIPSLVASLRFYLNSKYGDEHWNCLKKDERFLRLIKHYNFCSNESVFNELVKIVSEDLGISELRLIQNFSFFLFNGSKI